MNKIKIGVISMASLAMSGSVIGSAIAAISNDFPDVQFQLFNCYLHYQD